MENHGNVGFKLLSDFSATENVDRVLEQVCIRVSNPFHCGFTTLLSVLERIPTVHFQEFIEKFIRNLNIGLNCKTVFNEMIEYIDDRFSICRQHRFKMEMYSVCSFVYYALTAQTV